jgi:hypothetical protein
VEEVTTQAVDSRLEVRITYVVIARQERRYLTVDVTP